VAWDSGPPVSSLPGVDVVDDSLAQQALRRYPLCTHKQPWRCMTRGTVTRNGRLYAEVAYPLSQFVVVLLSSPLRNDLTSVSVVRKRVLIAGALATVFALVLGYGLATLFARRIRRLDSAAGRVAHRRFHLPLVGP